MHPAGGCRWPGRLRWVPWALRGEVGCTQDTDNSNPGGERRGLAGVHHLGARARRCLCSLG